MKIALVSVRDAVASQWLPIASVANLGAYLRALADEVNRPAEDNMFYKHPQDYECFKLGEWDDDTGVITAYEAPVSLVLLRTMVRGVQ